MGSILACKFYGFLLTACIHQKFIVHTYCIYAWLRKQSPCNAYGSLRTQPALTVRQQADRNEQLLMQ